MRLVVPYRSQGALDVAMEQLGFCPNILLVLVPGAMKNGHVEPASDVGAKDIPHVRGRGCGPSYIVPVGPDGGATEGIILRKGMDVVLLTPDAPSALVWAAARLAAGRANAYMVSGGTVAAMAPILPEPPSLPPAEYDYGGD